VPAIHRLCDGRSRIVTRESPKWTRRGIVAKHTAAPYGTEKAWLNRETRGARLRSAFAAVMFDVLLKFSPCVALLFSSLH
jgi:hypothetical protein